MNYNAIAAWSAVIASLVAMIALLLEQRAYRFSLSIDLILKMDERFDSSQMRRTRQAAAKALLNQRYDKAEDVLDFFETLGMLAKRKALNDEMVWATFFYWLNNYWWAAKEHIWILQKEDKTVYSYIGDFRKRMLIIEIKKRRCSESDVDPSEESLKAFLDYESCLASDD